MSRTVYLVFTEPANPGGRNRGGRHVEYGIALALSKDIVVVGEPENVFHNLAGIVFAPRDELHNPGTRIAHAASFEDVWDALAAWLYVHPEPEPAR